MIKLSSILNVVSQCISFTMIQDSYLSTFGIKYVYFFTYSDGSSFLCRQHLTYHRCKCMSHLHQYKWHHSCMGCWHNRLRQLKYSQLFIQLHSPNFSPNIHEYYFGKITANLPMVKKGIFYLMDIHHNYFTKYLIIQKSSEIGYMHIAVLCYFFRNDFFKLFSRFINVLCVKPS